MARKIFPRGVGDTSGSAFKLFFFSEGYLAAQSGQFAADCLDFIERFYTVTPFNLTRARPHWLNVYTFFTPSANAGPSINTPAAAGRTAFDSTYTSATGLLSADGAKVNAFIEAAAIKSSTGDKALNTLLVKGSPTFGYSGSLVVLLLPPIAGNPNGGEFENTPGATDYHYMAVSRDGLWHQPILRSIARAFGLGDEYEQAGADHLAPSPEQAREILPINLQFYPSGPPNPVSPETKWYSLMTAIQRTQPPQVHPKSDPSVVDTTLDNPPFLPVGIEFHEGGGGFRTRVWRSAHDCLMRRKIGDNALPTRTTPVPFCAVCRHIIRGVIE